MPEAAAIVADVAAGCKCNTDACELTASMRDGPSATVTWFGRRDEEKDDAAQSPSLPVDRFDYVGGSAGHRPGGSAATSPARTWTASSTLPPWTSRWSAPARSAGTPADASTDASPPAAWPAASPRSADIGPAAMIGPIPGHDQRDGRQHLAAQLTQAGGRTRVFDVHSRRGVHLRRQHPLLVVAARHHRDLLARDTEGMNRAGAVGGRGQVREDDARTRGCGIGGILR